MRARSPVAVVCVIAALQAACGSSTSQPPAASPTSSQACRSVALPSTPVALNPVETPTAGFGLTVNSQPVGIVHDNDGLSVWLLATGLDRVLHVTSTGDATSYQLPRSGLGIQLSQASDGTVWVPEQFRDAIMGIAADGTARECKLPGTAREPVATSVAADGAVWVSEARGGAIAKLVNGQFTEYPIGESGVKGAEVLAAADGSVWFSVMGAPFIGHVTSQGQVERIPIGGSGITLGLLETPDHAIWVADFDGSRVVRLTENKVQNVWSAPPGSKPQGLALGPAGVVWVTESGADKIASVRGSALEPDYDTGHWPDHIAITTDGWAWFTEYNGDRLGRVHLPAT